MLLPLLISTARPDAADTARTDVTGAPPPAIQLAAGCRFCGGGLGQHAGPESDCALCTLVRHLERPDIDDEAQLIWLPEMSQAALTCLVREMHCQLRQAGERFDGAGGPAVVSPERGALHYARQVLAARAEVAGEHLGTALPSELAQVLTCLSASAYERRHHLLGGLRILPSGRFFVGAEDVYPAIVDDWRAHAISQSSTRSAA